MLRWAAPSEEVQQTPVRVDSVGLTLVYLPQALCHIKEIPSTGSHDDPLSYYQIGDLIRGQFSPPVACKQIQLHIVFIHIIPLTSTWRLIEF